MSPDARLSILAIHTEAEHLLSGVAAAAGAVEGSTFELAIGFVMEEGGGRVARLAFFEPDHEDAIRACVEEWSAPARRSLARGFVQVDRRGGGWVESHEPTPDAGGRMLAESEDAFAQLADGVGRIGLLVDGELAYLELWEPDEGALLARYEELIAPGIRPVHPVVRAMTERHYRYFNERDWEAWGADYADDFVGRDLRVHAATENRGPAETVKVFKDVVAMMPNVHMTGDLLVGEARPGGVQTMAMIMTVRDRENAEVRTGVVTVTRYGKSWRTDMVEDDVDAVLAHYDATREALLRELP